MESELKSPDHLMLLVGTNPLPNYVVARYLNPKKVWLVYTAQTSDVCERLERILGGDCNPVKLESPYRPEMVLRTCLNCLSQLDGNIHLHYTGGTKVMSVEAVQAAVEVKPQATVSYLDPQTFRLRTATGGEFPHGHDLRRSVKPDLKTLLDLHGCDLLYREPSAWTAIADAMRGFVLTLETRAKRDAFAAWLEWLLPDDPGGNREEFEKRCGEWAARHSDPVPWYDADEVGPVLAARGAPANRGRRTTDEELLRAWETSRADFAPVKAAFASDAAYTVTKSPCDWGANKDQRQRRAVRFVHFMRGGWLEQRVASCQALKTGLGQDGVHVGVRAVRRNAPPEGRDMELDVVALNGYSLTLLSCTSSVGVKWIKLKAFEALHRARQLGGDEALAVVVSLAKHSDLHDLSQDLALDYGVSPGLRFVSWEGLRDLEASLEGVTNTKDPSKVVF